jgi:hypothetical protein
MISVGLQMGLVPKMAFQRQFECWRMGEKFVLGCYNDKCWFANRVRAFQRQFKCQRMDGKFVLGCLLETEIINSSTSLIYQV